MFSIVQDSRIQFGKKEIEDHLIYISLYACDHKIFRNMLSVLYLSNYYQQFIGYKLGWLSSLHIGYLILKYTTITATINNMILTFVLDPPDWSTPAERDRVGPSHENQCKGPKYFYKNIN